MGSDTRYLGGAIWTKGAALLWLPEKPGDTKTFVLKADEAGRMRLHVTFAMTHNSGRVSATLNGKPVKWDGGHEDGILDLRAPHRVLSRVFSLPPMESHTLRLALIFCGYRRRLRELKAQTAK